MAYATDADHADHHDPDRLAAVDVFHQPQGHRHPLPAVLVLRRPRRRRLLDPDAHGAAGAGAADLLQSAGLQRGRHRPRPDHGVLPGHAGPHRRLRQLVRAADDRRARHGVPAHEQHLVLAHRRRLLPALSCSLFVEGAPGSLGFGGGWTVYPPLSTVGPSRAGARFRHPRRCTSPAPPRSSAPSTSSPRSSTCARPA